MDAIALARQVQNIYSLPEIVVRINAILSSGNFSMADLEQVILHDPALTAKLLKIVNSSYFGLPVKVDTVSRALAMLGVQQLQSLVLGVSVTAQFKNIPAELVDMNAFWYHSVVKGVLAKLLAKHFRWGDYERFYITGLLSSLGRLILLSQYPEQMQLILLLEDQNDAAVLAAEAECFGFDHAELGAALLYVWRLPEEIWWPVRHQFDPMHENAPIREACLLHVAAKIANTLQPCRYQEFDYDSRQPEFNPGVLEYLQLSPQVIQALTAEALLYPFEILSIINPPGFLAF